MAEYELSFDWDPPKAVANARKHGVTFEIAATVFRDPEALSLYDARHSQQEDRWVTLGLDSHGRLLVVSHTWRETTGERANCRIISARKATRHEARQYYNR